MIRLFRDFNFVNFIYLLVLLFLLRIGIYINLPAEVNSGFLDFFSRLLVQTNKYQDLNSFANISLAGILVYLQAIWFNQILNNYNILGRASFIPALIYVILSSTFTPFLLLTPPLICNFFLLFIVHKLLISYRDPSTISMMFDLGMIIAVGTIFYFPFILFLLLLWIALIILKPFNWREWVAALSGYLTIVLFLGTYYFYKGELAEFYEIWKPLSNKFPYYVKINVLDYIVLLPIALVMVLSFFQIRQNFFKSYVLVRKFYQLLVCMFLVAAASFYLKIDIRVNHFILCVIPVAGFLAYYFANARLRWAYEGFLILIVGFIIYFQFV